jgi:hypothetical protein
MLGSRTLQAEGMRELLEGKFAAALRNAASALTMETMHEERRNYAPAVKVLASEDLALSASARWKRCKSSSARHLRKPRLPLAKKSSARASRQSVALAKRGL